MAAEHIENAKRCRNCLNVVYGLCGSLFRGTSHFDHNNRARLVICVKRRCS
jgi:hypothetical protein